VLLATYTIKCLEPNDTLANLQFFQMLHGHPAEEASLAVSSVYDFSLWPDPLSGYKPRNPVHKVGGFSYDITQWNDPTAPNATSNHRDFVGFSSNVVPDFIDNGTFRGHDYSKPPRGTHIRIENRDLNGTYGIFNDQVAGLLFIFGCEF
jgi:hypothetical protein